MLHFVTRVVVFLGDYIMGKWGHSDTANETGCTTSQAAAAEHVSRDDATKDGSFERGNHTLNSTPLSRVDSCSDAKDSAGGFWSSIFGR